VRKHNVTKIHAVLVTVLLGFGLASAAAATYTQITVPGSVSTQARAINNIARRTSRFPMRRCASTHA
jgi:hypothetical protein